MYISSAPDQLQSSAEHHDLKRFGPLSLVPLHMVGLQQLNDITLQLVTYNITCKFNNKPKFIMNL